MKDNPQLEPVIKRMMLEKLPADVDVTKLDTILLRSLLAKGVAGDASVVDAATALRMATLNGARALGWDARIGSIELGKAADLTAVRLDEIETQPLYHVASQLVYAGSRRQVSDVWIAGRRKLTAGELVDIDRSALLARAAGWAAKIAA